MRISINKSGNYSKENKKLKSYNRLWERQKYKFIKVNLCYLKRDRQD